MEVRNSHHSFVRDSLHPELPKDNANDPNGFNYSLPRVNDDVASRLREILHMYENGGTTSSDPCIHNADDSSQPSRKHSYGKLTNFCWKCNFSRELFRDTDQFSPLLSSLNDIKKRIFWNKQPSGWQHSLIESNPSSVLIGYISQAKNGLFYIADDGQSVPCVFIEDSNSDHTNLVCELNFGTSSFIVAIKTCYFLFEQFVLNDATVASNVCLFIPLSFVVLLDKKGHSETEDYHSKFKSTSTVHESNGVENEQCENQALDDDISEIVNDLQSKLTLDRSSRCRKKLYVCQEFTVIMKAWSFVKCEVQYQSIILALHQKRTTFAQHTDDVLGRLEDDCPGNSEAVDDLSAQMSGMTIDYSETLAIMKFDAALSAVCASLRPRHSYYIIYAPDSVPDIMLMNTQHSKPKELRVIKFTNNMILLHSNACKNLMEISGKHDLHLTQVSSVSEIVSKRMITHSLLKAILLDKFFIEENVQSSGKPLNSKKYTLCLLLKDEVTSHVLRLYVPFYPNDLFGLLPGTLVMLYGCLCVSSQKNTLYLRASSSFGVQVLKSSWSSAYPNRYENKLPLLLSTIRDPLPFTGQGFLLRITSIKVSMICNECFQERETCKCGTCTETLHAEASFEVDDGSSVALMHCIGDDVGSLLKLTNKEWQFLLSDVKEGEGCLRFNSSEKPARISSIPSKILHHTCTSHSLNRIIAYQCIPSWILSEKKQLKLNYLCRDISNLPRDAAIDLYASFREREYKISS